MHGSAHAFIESVFSTKYLSERPVEGVVYCEIFDVSLCKRLYYAQRGAIHVGFHGVRQR